MDRDLAMGDMDDSTYLIYEAVVAEAQRLEAEGNVDGAEALDDLADRITGWCAAHRRIFPVKDAE